MNEYILSVIKISFIASPFIALLCFSSLKEKISVKLRLSLWVFLCALLIISPNFKSFKPVFTLTVPQNKTLAQVYIPQLSDQEVSDIVAEKALPQGVNIPQGDKASTFTNNNEQNIIKKPLPSLKFFYRPISQLVVISWASGFICFCLFYLVSFLRFNFMVKKGKLPSVTAQIADAYTALCEEKQLKGQVGLIQSCCVKVPFLMGTFHPCIVMPVENYSPQELDIILRHELQHYENRDLSLKMLALFANAIHWFNPLAYCLVAGLGGDIEIACDAKTLKNSSLDYKKNYSLTILQLCSAQSLVSHSFVTEISGGKNQLKNRFKAILSPQNSKKGLALALSLVILASSLTACYDVKPDDKGTGNSNLTVTDATGLSEETKQAVWETVYPLVRFMRYSNDTTFDEIINPKDSKDLLSLSYTYTMYYLRSSGKIKEFPEAEGVVTIPISYMNQLMNDTFGLSVNYTRKDCEVFGTEVGGVDKTTDSLTTSISGETIQKQLYSDVHTVTPLTVDGFDLSENGDIKCVITDRSEDKQFTFTVKQREDGGFLIVSGIAEKAEASDESANSVGSDQSGKMSIIWPVNSTRISRAFNKDHDGIDIAAELGSEILSAADGTVTLATEGKDGQGKYIEIDHGNGILTQYQHCSELLVEKGDTVSQGQVIGKVGSTGDSTGNHLHFMVIKTVNETEGSAVDPFTIFDEEEYLYFTF